MSFRIRSGSALSSGGTISGNLLITGTLGVQGAVTLDVAQTVTGNADFQGTVIVDITNAEALLVRQNSNGGDVFTVNTTTPGVLIAGTLDVTGDLTLAGTVTAQGIHIVDITNVEAFLVRQNSDSGDVFAIDTTNKRILIGTPGVDGDDETPPATLTVTGGSMEVYDPSDLGAETITDGGFPNSTNWAGATDWSDTISGTTTYTHSAGSGTLTQTAAQRVTGNEGSNARWYKLTYTVSAVTAVGALVLTITNAFAASAVTLDVSSNATRSVIFQAHATTADTADFVFSATSDTASDTFTLDDVILKEIVGGDFILGGKLTGGGTKGLQVSGGGTVATFENDLGTVGATETIDWRDGNHQKLTLDENLTLTFIDPDAPTNLVVHFVQDGAGTNTVAWPANVDWEGGTAPTISAGAADIDIITLYFDGSRYFGGFLQDFS